MWASSLLVVSLALGIAPPAAYAPMPVDEARTELRAAAQATAAQPHVTMTQVSHSMVDVLRFSAWAVERVSGTTRHPSQERVRAFRDGTRFHSIAAKDRLRAKVRNYLQAPQLRWMESSNAVDQWQQMPTIGFGPLAGARVKIRSDGTRHYRVREGPRARAALTVDAAGRLVAVSARSREGGKWADAGRTSWFFEEFTVGRPAPGEALPEALVTPAIEAAGIPAQLRMVIGWLRPMTDWTRADLRHAVRENVGHVDATVSSKAARLHWATTERGVRIWGHNQYTDVTYTWRVVKRHCEWVKQRA